MAHHSTWAVGNCSEAAAAHDPRSPHSARTRSRWRPRVRRQGPPSRGAVRYLRLSGWIRIGGNLEGGNALEILRSRIHLPRLFGPEVGHVHAGTGLSPWLRGKEGRGEGQPTDEHPKRHHKAANYSQYPQQRFHPALLLKPPRECGTASPVPAEGTDDAIVTARWWRASRPTALQSQEPGLYFALALDFDSAARLEDELALKSLVDGARHLNRVGDAA